MNYKSLKEKLSPSVAKALEDLKAELVDIAFTRQKGEMTVTVFVYKKDGLDIDLLQEASEKLDPIFEAEKELKDKYYLEISSPGIDRPIKTDDDFRRNMDMKLDAKLKNNEKHIGILKKYDEESFTLDCDGKIIEIKRADVKKLTQAIEF
ncbi:ribosome maturation factor RimP [Fenollaria massiliensis]|uniref:Ribosome maturation factor RimP n=1 Tax=Fenollaria massiliensis TaxID=938288 RepID=A0A9E7DIH5_9FIRM|nr:ribosome maturation factor RimP [Fenollaria massiliensis]UQK58590.1 ribosome maturation factor RimP [Fenollaria massiliensis]